MVKNSPKRSLGSKLLDRTPIEKTIVFQASQEVVRRMYGLDIGEKSKAQKERKKYLKWAREHY